MKKFVYSLLFFIISAAASADVRLPNIFGDNMVLQRDKPITVWGWATPGEEVTVQLDKQSKKVTAGKDGKWKLTLNAMRAGGPFQLTVKGKNTISLNNVLIGEVWICSGQSNMEWRVQNSNDAETEIASANYPHIRHIKVPREVAGAPMDDIGEAEWAICSPETVAQFTAVGYFFARQLQDEINVPIGLINTSWGGTHIETWTSREAFEESDEFRSMIASMKTLNLDSIRRQNERAIVRKIEKIQGPIRKPGQSVAAWKDINFEDSTWPTMQLPGLWERSALGNMDGVVWFRKIITLDGSETGKEAVLHLGAVDDSDETYVNGVKVGGTNDRTTKRSYSVEPGVFKAGKNVIAVRVEDTGGGGGIYGESNDLHISFSDTKVALAGSWSFQVESLLRTNGDVSPNQFPTLLFNAMINPLIPYSIRGALWYQGESNAGRAYQYRKAFPLMINDWRKRWGQGDFPFYFVQLATFNANNGNSNNGSGWAELREAQAMTLSLPNTGMAVTTDIGDPKDIHPRNKQDVAKRLAALALRDIYGKQIVASGPSYVSMQRSGNKIILTFSNTGSGLMVKDKYGYIKGFEIAGSDQKFVYAQAHLDGNKIVVYHKDVAEPVAVRFGWADDAGDCNLFNNEGFPVAPFRTDDWKSFTAENRFNFVYPQ